MMLMTGIGVLSAAIPVPVAGAEPSRPDGPVAPAPAPTAPVPTAQTPGFLFPDAFNGRAGSAPDPSKWIVAKARETIKNPVF